MRICSLVLLLVLSLLPAASGLKIENVDPYVLDKEASLGEETWIFSNKVSFEGETKEDLFIAANAVLLDGTMRNDVWVAANSIYCSAKILDHARFMASRTLSFEGHVGSSLTAFADTISIGKNATVQGTAALAGQNVIVEGQVKGKLSIMAYHATLSGKFMGDVRIVAEDIIVMPGTEIKGNLTYTSSRDLFLDEKVLLTGQLVKKNIQTAPLASAKPSVNQAFALQSFLFLSALIVGLPFAGMFPQFTGRTVRLIRQSSWKCGIAGIVAFCLIPMIGLFAVATLIGLSLGLILLTAYFTCLYLCKIFMALALGGFLLRRRGPQSFRTVFSAMSIGLVLLYMLYALPVAGSVIWLFATLVGLGGMVLALFGHGEPEPIPPPLAATPNPQPASTNTNPKDL